MKPLFIFFIFELVVIASSTRGGNATMNDEFQGKLTEVSRSVGNIVEPVDSQFLGRNLLKLYVLYILYNQHVVASVGVDTEYNHGLLKLFPSLGKAPIKKVISRNEPLASRFDTSIVIKNDFMEALAADGVCHEEAEHIFNVFASVPRHTTLVELRNEYMRQSAQLEKILGELGLADTTRRPDVMERVDAESRVHADQI